MEAAKHQPRGPRDRAAADSAELCRRLCAVRWIGRRTPPTAFGSVAVGRGDNRNRSILGTGVAGQPISFSARKLAAGCGSDRMRHRNAAAESRDRNDFGERLVFGLFAAGVGQLSARNVLSRSAAVATKTLVARCGQSAVSVSWHHNLRGNRSRFDGDRSRRIEVVCRRRVDAGRVDHVHRDQLVGVDRKKLLARKRESAADRFVAGSLGVGVARNVAGGFGQQSDHVLCELDDQRRRIVGDVAPSEKRETNRDCVGRAEPKFVVGVEPRDGKIQH